MIDFILMFLCALPIAAVGWFGGMVFMRANYPHGMPPPPGAP